MERPVGRLRDKLDIAIDCLCRMTLGARSLPHRLWVGVAMSSSVAHCQGQGAAVSSGVAVALFSALRAWPKHHRVQTWWSALALLAWAMVSFMSWMTGLSGFQTRAYALVRGLRLPPPASLGQRPTPNDPGNSRSSYLLGTGWGLRLLFLAGLVDGAAVPEDDADVLARIVAGAFAGEPDVDALARASLADRPARRDAYTV